MDIQHAIRNVGMRVANSAGSYFYDADNKKKAMSAVHMIQKYNSERLTPQIRRAAIEYSVEVLGSKRYSPWLFVYALIRGKFQEGWIPDNFYGKMVVPRVNKDLRTATNFKSFSKVVLRTEALPDIAYYIDGVLYDNSLSIIDIAKLRELSFDSRLDEVFVKRDDSDRGIGVMKLTGQGLNENNLQRIGNCVIQSSIKQHGFFEEIISGCVATVRITTVKDSTGKINMRAAYLRMGRKDTPWVQSDNSLRVAIINASGDLDFFAYTQDWRRWLFHPDSGFCFENKRIPKFKEAVALCLELHHRVPHLTIIGWDIAICENEKVKLLEWNGAHCDIIFSEATTGPCFLGLGWEKYRENQFWEKSRDGMPVHDITIS